MRPPDFAGRFTGDEWGRLSSSGICWEYKVAPVPSGDIF